jgi:hypothetical protein
MVLDKMEEILTSYEKNRDETKLFQVSTLMNVMQPRIKAIYSSHYKEIIGHKDSILYISKTMKEIVEKTRFYVLNDADPSYSIVDSPQIKL